MLNSNNQKELENELSIWGLDSNWRCQGVVCYAVLEMVTGIDPGPELFDFNFDLNELRRKVSMWNDGKSEDFELVKKLDKWLELGLKYGCKIDIF